MQLQVLRALYIEEVSKPRLPACLQSKEKEGMPAHGSLDSGHKEITPVVGTLQRNHAYWVQYIQARCN